MYILSTPVQNTVPRVSPEVNFEHRGRPKAWERLNLGHIKTMEAKGRNNCYSK